MPGYESIPRKTIICAARHYIAAHEFACNDGPFDFGSVCTHCDMWSECRGDWLTAAAPLFDAAGVHPKVLRSLASRKENSPAAATAEESSFNETAKKQESREEGYRLSAIGEIYLEVHTLKNLLRFQSVLLGINIGCLIGLFWIISSNL